MTQDVVFLLDGQVVMRYLPDPEERVIGDITWGRYEHLFTPAYWVSQIWMNKLEHLDKSPYHSQRTLEEEIVFCMLSGFGVKTEVVSAAFHACHKHGLIERRCSDPDLWSDVLKMPLCVNDRKVRYRYPNQKAKFLANAMENIKAKRIDINSGRALRDSLLKIKGCGWKIAGYIARNYLDSDEVAILDIHVVRAGILMGLFSEKDRVERDYESMEQRFLDFCKAIQVRPSVLDCLIWSQMRTMGTYAIDAVKYKLMKKDGHTMRVHKRGQLSLALE